jgi:hypothetical protein
MQQRQTDPGELPLKLAHLFGLRPSPDPRNKPSDRDRPVPVLRIDDRNSARADHEMIDVTEPQEPQTVHDHACAPSQEPLQVSADQLLARQSLLDRGVVCIP